jgi:CHAT domain-containing protein
MIAGETWLSGDLLSCDATRLFSLGSSSRQDCRSQSCSTNSGSKIAQNLRAHFQRDNLYGALLLTPGPTADQTDNDGLLQLREIYTLDLSRCQLAVLSACETNVGPERPLEAGMSMARAFIEQGAKRVVCSQWSVDEVATAELIKAFFDQFRTARAAGQPDDYAESLTAAKKTLREDPRWKAKPGYWSALVLVGAAEDAAPTF